MYGTLVFCSGIFQTIGVKYIGFNLFSQAQNLWDAQHIKSEPGTFLILYPIYNLRMRFLLLKILRNTNKPVLETIYFTF